MNIGILGTRGIPNEYGGFEQFAQHLAEGLHARGHEVSVYNSSKHSYRQKSWKGIQILKCLDLEASLGTAGQFIYDLNCIRDARKRNFDILLHLGYTSDSIWNKFWPRRAINFVNMDGLEWKRTKYSRPVQQFLKHAERLAAKNADYLVSDSTAIQSYLLEKYNRTSVFIPYGAEIFGDADADVISKWNLSQNGYFLIIARMEPENNLELILDGYILSPQTKKMVVVGKTENRFGKYLRKKYQSNNILFAGGIYETTLVNNLRHFCSLYFHGHSVGGTNPSLLEAMACGCPIAAHANPFNKAVLSENAYYFDSPSEVKGIIENIEESKFQSSLNVRANLEKIEKVYNWQSIIDQYEKAFIDANKK